MSLPIVYDDHFHEECAVVGVIGHPDAANFCYLGLYAMQHRGQEGAGIVSTDGQKLFSYKDMGLVADVFDEKTLAELKGIGAIGHTRYATFGGKNFQNLQPFIANLSEAAFAIGHNGNLINAHEIRLELERAGAIFSTTSDTEVFLHLMARAPVPAGSKNYFVERLRHALDRVRGAYSLVILGLDRLIAVRDPLGIRPLSIGRIGGAHVVASETCAFDLIGAEFVRDVLPGEVVEIRADGSITSPLNLRADRPGLCVFEYVYFSRPDSTIEGRDVYDVRKRLGMQLAKEHPTEADLVIPVPDSGVPAALGYAQASGLPMEFGLIRNHYIGRTFIEPKQSIRDFGVKIKLNANADVLRGKRVVVVDDSIVRGTTSRKIVNMLRTAGAAEVHFRVSSPPTTGPCHYGIDTPSYDELIAARMPVDGIRDYLGANSLGYLSNEGMFAAVRGDNRDFCDACFSGNYRVGVPMAVENDPTAMTCDVSTLGLGNPGHS